MIAKILVTFAVIFGVLILLPKLLRAGQRLGDGGGARPPARTETLIQCPTCGVYHRPLDPCDCGRRPTGRK